jgi:hypothetical protein
MGVEAGVVVLKTYMVHVYIQMSEENNVLMAKKQILI